MIKPTALLFMLFISLQSFGAINCSIDQSPHIKDQFFISSTVVNQAPDCEFLQNVHDTLNEVNSMFNYDSPIVLMMNGESDNPSFDQGHLLRFPQVYIRSNGTGEKIYRSGNEILPILVHEYGHAMVRDRWEKVFPRFSKLYNLARELSEYIIEITVATDELKNPELSQEEINILKGKRFRADKNAESVAMQIDLEPNYYIVGDLVPYNELLADVVAVYFFDDKDTIARTIDHPHFTEEEQMRVDARSFSRDPNFVMENETPHTKLRTVRYHIGQNYMPSNDEEKKIFFEKICAAVEREIVRLFINYEGDLDDMDQKLIEEIDKEFQ